jgi:hypothetical protein
MAGFPEAEPNLDAPPEPELSEGSVNAFHISVHRLAYGEKIPAQNEGEIDRMQALYQLPDSRLLDTISFDRDGKGATDEVLFVTEYGTDRNNPWEHVTMYHEIGGQVLRSRFALSGPEKLAGATMKLEQAAGEALQLGQDTKFYNENGAEIVDQAEMNALNGTLAAVDKIHDSITREQYNALPRVRRAA